MFGWIEAAEHAHHPGGKTAVFETYGISDTADLIHRPGKVLFEESGALLAELLLKAIESDCSLFPRLSDHLGVHNLFMRL